MKLAAALLAIAIAAGLLAPQPAPAPPRRMGEYTVLTGDFHVHMFPLDGATLAPWDVVIEARRRGLHVIALTGHNQTWTAKVGRWFAQRTGGPPPQWPIVLIGQETITPPYDMIGVGLTHDVDWRGDAADVVRRTHEQGGAAIAAHPVRDLWPGLEPALQTLDGAEVLHPMRFSEPRYATELDEFFARRTLTAIGSSDFHATGFPGYSRTYVFVREITEAAVLDALREHRTVGVGETTATSATPNSSPWPKRTAASSPRHKSPIAAPGGLSAAMPGSARCCSLACSASGNERNTQVFANLVTHAPESRQPF